jgi:hypothetical protein
MKLHFTSVLIPRRRGWRPETFQRDGGKGFPFPDSQLEGKKSRDFSNSPRLR